MTQIMDAKKGILTDEMKQVAAKENVSEEFILKSVANGTIVIPSNVNRDIEASGIGAGLRTKVNATVGTSTDIVDFDEEVLKAQIAIDNGADCLMELSIGGDLDVIRRRVLDIASFNDRCQNRNGRRLTSTIVANQTKNFPITNL